MGLAPGPVVRAAMAERVRIGRYSVELSNLDKPFFPEDGITKGDLVEYYRSIATTMLPYLRGRPIAMHRFPDGIVGEGFYQKDAPDYFPPWIERVRVEKEDGTVDHVVCGKAADLVYLANQGCITPHIWPSRRNRLDNPDLMVFDLDPADDSDFESVRRAARSLRDLLERLGLVPFVQTTGSRGAHVAVPLDCGEGFDAVRAFAQQVARLLARRHPQHLTVEQRKEKRGTRLYIDTGRNAYGQTFVAPYAVRPRRGAPVATPLRWEELDGVESQSYHLRNVSQRLRQAGDPWQGMWRHARPLHQARQKLGELGL